MTHLIPSNRESARHLKALMLTVTSVTLAAALSACGGGGGGASAPSTNTTVAAQVQNLQPTDPNDTVGIFVALQTPTPTSGAAVTASADQLRAQAQDQFLQELSAAVARPAAGASTGGTCDAAALAGRLQAAYKPSSGAAVRIELNACELGLLPGLSSVKGVYADVPLAPSATATSETVALFNKAIVDSYNSTTAWPSYKAGSVNATGSNAVIAVLDTGVEDRHPALSAAGKVLQGACFSTPSVSGVGFCPQWASNGSIADTTSADAGRSCVDKFGSAGADPALRAGCGHGTSMAGAAALAYTNGSVSAGGIAKAASVLPVQVFSGGMANGVVSISANSGDLLRGIEWVTAQAQARKAAGQTPIVALNMSLGGGSYAAACDSDYVGGLFYTAFSNLRAQGVIPVVAAGNSYNTSAISFPACVSNTVSVAAAKLGASAAASYTNFSAQVKLFAIGGDIDAKYSMPVPCANPAVNTECWAAGAGTSPATALVSGAVAVLRSMKPEASLAEIEAALQNSDQQLSVGGISRPVLRLTKAGAQLLGVAGADTPTTPPTTPPTQGEAPKLPPPAAPTYTRLCIYSLPNYQGVRACGVFQKGDAIVINGFWMVESVKFFAFDPANPLDTTPLEATPRPNLTLYRTLSRFNRAAAGTTVSTDTPDFTQHPPGTWVRTLRFDWAAN